MLNSSIRQIRTLMGLFLIMLALCLCYAGAVSHGSSPSSKSPRVRVERVNFYPTFGTPNDALVTDDDAYVLVSVSNPTPCPGRPTPTSTPAGNFTGVQVLRKSDFTNPCGGQQIINFPPPHRRGPLVQ